MYAREEKLNGRARVCVCERRCAVHLSSASNRILCEIQCDRHQKKKKRTTNSRPILATNEKYISISISFFFILFLVRACDSACSPSSSSSHSFFFISIASSVPRIKFGFAWYSQRVCVCVCGWVWRAQCLAHRPWFFEVKTLIIIFRDLDWPIEWWLTFLMRSRAYTIRF